MSSAAEALALAFRRHADVAEIEQWLRGLVFPDPSPERGVPFGVIPEDLRLIARRSRPDGFVLLACVGRDPHGDPGSLIGHPDPATPGVLAVVVREVASDPLLEPLLAERPAQHRFGVQRASRRVDDDRQVLGRRGTYLHDARDYVARDQHRTARDRIVYVGSI